ncbi:MAG TPA: DUF2085 domain-containing protein [Thermomicrobiales bacterium]|nr:DUF2085 domain-containing protein [Thermomicrobiales bacterium]
MGDSRTHHPSVRLVANRPHRTTAIGRYMIAEHPARTSPTTPSATSTRVIIALDRRIYRFAAHWLRWTNLLFISYVALILAAPIMTAVGFRSLAKPLYQFFGLFCHQQGDRSFHIAGHPLACCERCAAVYLSLALSGVLYAMFRSRIRRIRYPELVLLLTPLVIDGMAVGAELYPGNALVRVITGMLFGLGLSWLLFPWLDHGFTGIRLRLETLFTRLVAQGRATPLRT